MAPKAAENSRSPLYSTTFTTHTLSPLYHGPKPLLNATLTHHASRLRDVLVGDVLRGVRVGLAAEDEVLSRVGALRRVQWRLLPEGDAPVPTEETQLDAETSGLEDASIGMHIDIEYEKAVYTAILLQPAGVASAAMPGQPGFSHFPMLLTRMPASLRATLLDFISTNFDARASPLRLGPQVLASQFEKYISDLLANDQDPSETTIGSALRLIIKDLLISLTFNLPQGTSSLKSIDITVPKEDLSSMLRYGRKLAQSNGAQPFMAALAYYINGHTALDINHARVNISKIACGAFVLGAEGRIKLFPPPTGADENSAQARATKALISRLVDIARGKPED